MLAALLSPLHYVAVFSSHNDPCPAFLFFFLDIFYEVCWSRETSSLLSGSDDNQSFACRLCYNSFNISLILFLQ